MSVGKPTIPEFFSGCQVFITGGSGFLGKALIEKLLRSCPKVGNIYLLMRPKKGISSEERLKPIVEHAIFDTVRKQQPGALSKLNIVNGDASAPNLGLSEEDRRMLSENVNIFFHGAASVRFDDSLKYAILMNTRGTREAVSLAMEMKKLKIFVHLSTAYTNTNRKVIGEQMYPPHADWRIAIKIAEEQDEFTLNALTAKYMGGLPNTYVFTKQLSEHVVYDMCSGKIPAVIFRPSIVVSSMEEPVPGWIDNYNGPTGIVVAVGTGVMRSIFIDPDLRPDYIPVDVLIRGLIAVTWHEAISFPKSDNLVPVYNGCGGEGFSMSTKELVHIGQPLVWESGMKDQIWHPYTIVTDNIYLHYLTVFFLQLLPALLIDFCLLLFKKKPMLIRVQRKIFIATMALQYFSFNSWTFLRDKFMSINNVLLDSDVNDFWIRKEFVDRYSMCTQAMYGGKKWLLNEQEKDQEKFRMRSYRLRLLHFSILYTFYMVAFMYFVLYVRSLPTKMYSLYVQLFE